MVKIFLLCVSFLTLLLAEDSQESYIKELQEDVSKYSKIATDIKQNVDYMPYVVSTLNSKELTKLGVLSLREALSLIPGVDLSIGATGLKNPIFRGSNPFIMGQSKLIIDGVVVNDQMYGAYNQYLDMPIDIIQRIEVVRGPGSLLSNVNAYAGSIHVITKANRIDGGKKEKSVFGIVGSDRYAMGGFVLSYKENDLELNSDLFYLEHDRKLPAGADRFGNSFDAPQWLDNYAFGLSARYKDLYLKGRFAKNRSGVSYGESFSLSEDSSDYLDVENSFLEIGYKFDIYSGIEAKISVGYFDEHRELKNKVMPDASSMVTSDGIPMRLPYGYYFLFNYAEQTFNERFELKISSIQNHNITAGVTMSQNRLKDNIAKHSIDNLQSFSQITKLLDENHPEHIIWYVDDLINLNEKTSIQLGLKVDDLSDLETQFSPRFALVHRYDDENIYKFMYTHSYREPSLREEYLEGAHYFNSAPVIQVEKVDAYEASYIRKMNLNTNLEFNIFYLRNRDQINAENSTHTFKNSGDNELYGLEAEFKTTLINNNQLYINYSYVEGSNTENSLADSAQNMAKLYYIYKFDEHIDLSSILKYVGEKRRIDGDTRENVDDYLTADFSVVYTYKPYDLMLSASLKNLFDQKYYLPAPNGTYERDFQQEGRSFLIRMSKTF